MTRVYRYVQASLLGIAICQVAHGQVVNEIEPNETRTQATVTPPLNPGAVLTGITTGAFTSAPGIQSADMFLVRTAPAPLGVYRHRLVMQQPGTFALTGTIRGWTQTAGVINVGADVAVQTNSASTTVPPRFNMWYGFGRSEQVYYRVTGAATNTAPYSIQYDRQLIPTPNLGVFRPGMITISTVGQGHSSDTDLWVYDQNFNPIPGYENDDEGPNGPTLQSRLTRSYTAGRYYLALSRFNFANNLPSNSSDSDYQNGNVMDLPDSACDSNATVGTNVTFSMTDSEGSTQFPQTITEPFQVLWLCFDVAPGITDCNGNGTDDSADIQNGLSYDTDHNGVPDECQTSVTASQMTFVDANGAPLEPASNHGFLNLTALQPPDNSVSWLNIRVGSNWVVQNIPFIRHTCWRTIPYPYGCDFPLPTSGPQSSVVLAYSLTAQPLSSPPTVLSTYPLTQTTVYPSTSQSSISDPTLAFSPSPSAPFIYPLPFGIPMIIARTLGTVNEEVNGCGPGAGARCLDWMNSQYCLGFGATQDTPQELYDILKDANHMMSSLGANGTGTFYTKVASGINKLFMDKGLQNRAKATYLPNASPADALQAMKEGQDVIMLMGWYNANGVRTGGHIVVGSGGIMWPGGQTTLFFQDDAFGGDHQGDNQADGGKSKPAHVVPRAGGGWDITGFGATGRWEGMIKVCPSALQTLLASIKNLIGNIATGMEGIIPRLQRYQNGDIPTPNGLADLCDWTCSLRSTSRALATQLMATGAPQPIQDLANSNAGMANQLLTLMGGYAANPTPELIPPMLNLGAQIIGGAGPIQAYLDCNGNMIDDTYDIELGDSADCFNPGAAPNTMGGPDGRPDDCQCIANFNRDNEVNSNDVTGFLGAWFSDLVNGTLNADTNCDGETNSNDVTNFLNLWFDAIANGCE